MGKLILASDIRKALPLEDLKAYNAANPVAADGSVRFDEKLIEAREDALCRRLLSGLPVAILVLGSSHDLRDNLERLSGGTAEYLRVERDAWKAAVR